MTGSPSSKKKTGHCRVVAIIDRPLESIRLSQCIQQGITLFEIRFDQFRGTIEQAVNQAQKVRERGQTEQGQKQQGQIEIIGTFRNVDQISSNRLMKTIEKFVRNVDYLDIEYASLERESAIQLAKEQKKTIILSAHDFSAPFSQQQIAEIYEFSAKIGARISKFACMISRYLEYKSFLLSLKKINGDSKPLIAHMAMGRYGKISRIFAPYFQSCLAYGYLFAPNALGQISALRLSRIYRYLYAYQKI